MENFSAQRMRLIQRQTSEPTARFWLMISSHSFQISGNSKALIRKALKDNFEVPGAKLVKRDRLTIS